MSQLNKNSQTLESLIEYARELPEALDVDEVATQTSLISQIASALEGKAAGGGGGTLLTANGTKTFSSAATTMTVTGIPFDPKIVVVHDNTANDMPSGLTVLVCTPATAVSGGSMGDIFTVQFTHLSGTFTVTASSAVFAKSTTYYWYAYGA